MSDIKKREFGVGVFFLAVGLGYLYMTSNLPRKQFIDAAFIPYVLGSIMTLLGVLQLWAANKLGGGEASGKQVDKPDYATVLKTLGLIIAYVAFLDSVGFPIMTVVYLFMQFIVLKPIAKKATYLTYLMYGVIAILTSAAVFMTFRYAFDMMLPAGLLN